MLGMPANLAKDAVSLNPKRVLLNARESSLSPIPTLPNTYQFPNAPS